MDSHSVDWPSSNRTVSSLALVLIQNALGYPSEDWGRGSCLYLGETKLQNIMWQMNIGVILVFVLFCFDSISSSVEWRAVISEGMRMWGWCSLHSFTLLAAGCYGHHASPCHCHHPHTCDRAGSLTGKTAAAAPEVGAVTSVLPALCVRQQLFWSSRVRGGGEETQGSYWF